MQPGILGNTGKSTRPPIFNVMKASVALFRINAKQNIKAGGLGATLVTMISIRAAHFKMLPLVQTFKI